MDLDPKRPWHYWCKIKPVSSAVLCWSEWYLEKRGSRKIQARSQNLGNVFDGFVLG